MGELTYETVLALRIDVADRDRHIEELKIGCHALTRVRDLINNPRGRSFQAIVEDISEIIREDEP